jgi:cytochrome c-type biogenesis protein CcmH/NrfF
MKKNSSINKSNNSYRGKNPIWMILQMKPFWITFSLLFGLFLLIGIAEVFIPHNHDPIVQRTHEPKSTPEVESDVIRISSKFICTCGDCSGETLTICKCKYAVTERNLIRDLIDKKTKEEEIVKTINAKYGGLKNVSKL